MVGSRRAFAFTLVELLVVMAIIGLLAGLSLTAVSQVRHAARRAEARDHVSQIVTAWKAYLTDYREFPSQALETVNFQVMAILYATTNGTIVVGGEPKPLDTNANPRLNRYMEFSTAEWTRSEMLDPWDNPYRVAIDNGLGTNENGKSYDSIVRPAGYDDVRQYVVAWSVGRDGVNATADDVKSW